MEEQPDKLPETPAVPTPPAMVQPAIVQPAVVSTIIPDKPIRPDRFKRTLQVIGWFQFIALALSVAFLLFLMSLARSGASGTEFMALLLIPVIWLLTAVAIVNLIGLPIWLMTHKSELKVGWILSFLLSLALFAYGAFAFYQFKVAFPRKIASFEAELKEQDKEFEEVLEDANYTKEEAVAFLQACKADYFIGYTNDISLVHENVRSSVARAERSETGIDINDIDHPTYVFTSKAMTGELLETARSARAACDGKKPLSIYVDDTSEVKYTDGTWRSVKQPQ